MGLQCHTWKVSHYKVWSLFPVLPVDVVARYPNLAACQVEVQQLNLLLHLVNPHLVLGLHPVVWLLLAHWGQQVPLLFPEYY